MFLHSECIHLKRNPVMDATVIFSVLLCLKLNWAAESPIDCNFEQGNLCGYQQMSSTTGTLHDDMDWTLNQGPTHTSNSGPDNDHTYGNHSGHYIYINSVSGTHKMATLFSPVVQCHTTHATFTFWYNMYGATMGMLSVFTATPHLQVPKKVWSQSGNQGVGWKMATLTLDFSNLTEVIFTSVTGFGTHSDMAIDDISLSGASCVAAPVEFSWVCNFEQGNLCGYQQVSSTGIPHDDLDWMMHQEPTQSNLTGTDNHYTHGNGQGHYIYITSLFSGRRAMLASPTLYIESAHTCLKFWYSTYGDSPGQLSVVTATPHLQHLYTVWTTSGNLGPGWQSTSITLDTTAPFQIIFNGVTGSGNHSDIALDDITLTNGSCIDTETSTYIETEQSPVQCNFEQGNLCGYQQMSSTGTPHDDMDWTLNQGPTHTTNTGPDNDHTYGNRSGHYIYINSALNTYNKKATLVSPVVQCNTTHANLTFWYSMYGTTMGQLLVMTATPHLPNALHKWSKSGNQGAGWKMASVTLDLSHPTEIMFSGVGGWGTHSDMAIDDISLACDSRIVSAAVTHSTKPSTTVAFSMQSPTKAFSTHSPINTCQQCEGLDCFTTPVTINCSALQPLCSSRVTDSANGERRVTKGCISATDCNVWIPRDAEVQYCLSVDQQVTGHDLDCLFCCHGDLCNKGPKYIPERETWIGQNLHRLLIG